MSKILDAAESSLVILSQNINISICQFDLVQWSKVSIFVDNMENCASIKDFALWTHRGPKRGF
jgi:hypothetical protein